MQLPRNTLRAKIKPFETMPDKYKCCPEAVEELKLLPTDVLEVSCLTEETRAGCVYCGANYGVVKVRTSIKWPNLKIIVEMFNFDEGPESPSK